MQQRTLLALISLGLTGNAFAGCGESDGTCYYYKHGELRSQDHCLVTTCAAAAPYYFSTWDWDNGNRVSLAMQPETGALLVNGKPGYGLALPFKDSKLSCFSVTGSDEVLCNDSGNN